MQPVTSPVLRTLADQVGEAILQQIASGEIAPNTALPSQRELARRFGVNLSVVREAVQRLQTLRVVATHQGRPSMVENLRWKHLAADQSLRILELEKTMIREIWEARAGIEREIAKLAAVRANSADISRLGSILHRAETARLNFDEHQALNAEFHMALAGASKNEVFVDILEPLLNVHVSILKELFSAALTEDAWNSHKAIFQAVELRDVNRAAEAITAHAACFAFELDEMTRLLDARASSIADGSARVGINLT